MEPNGTDAALVAAGLIIVRQIFEMAAKAIPDTETGWKGALRKLLKTLALYTTNK